MNDLIDRQAAIDEIDEWIKAFLESGHKESAADARLIQDGIIQLPSVQPERKKGTWITTPYAGDDRLTNYRCPFCETGFSYVKCTQARPNFCMNCGADMRGDKE